MSSQIDMASITAKVKKYLSGSEGRKRVDKIKDDVLNGRIRATTINNRPVYSIDQAVAKFEFILINTMNGNGVPTGVQESLGEIYSSDPQKQSDGSYIVSLHFLGDTSRKSLNPDKYSDIESLAELYNDGVDHVMKQVYGNWRDHGEVGSRTVIGISDSEEGYVYGYHFLEDAADIFKGNYAYDYNVREIVIKKQYSGDHITY